MNKSEIRKIYAEKRKLLSPQDLELRSKVISDKFFKDFDLTGISSAHIFLPITSKREINTWHIINRFRQEQAHIKLLVSKSDLLDGKLENFIFTQSTVLIDNDWGIPEPQSGDRFPNQQIDLVFAPLLAFDKKGNRVGYGKGYYDKFLLECRPDVLKVGLSLEEPARKINAELFDIPLTHCITPLAVYNFLKPGRK
ncbi:MAG TPA: 5-formyltetrahydrofolate cyclo-ligase [Cytophagaceae bacterium]|jgi:5-formyltetrahydrofolate cyclo-ligase|nr:5-formyltetrahydrofolate cyclo-ligase [Cytophagaceae bacterium]